MEENENTLHVNKGYISIMCDAHDLMMMKCMLMQRDDNL